MSNLQSILDAADKYAEQTGIDLNENPFANKVKGCDSPSAILLLLQENLKAFKDYRDKNRKFIECVGPVVQVVHAFSGVLGEAAGLIPFQPAKLIFVGIDALFTAADGLSASYDALLELFECLGNFLKRLHVYTEISLNALMTDIVAKIMVELVSILAVAKKQIGRGRLKQFAKMLLGDSEIESILKRLDRLTQEEARMTVAQTLTVVHGLLNNMKVVMDGGELSTSAIRQTLISMQAVASEINKMKRDQLQKDARSWISPPDPSKNHVIARSIHSGESAVWFTRGRTFKDWDLTGGLLWIHGKPGSGKSILCSSIIEQATALNNEGLSLVAYYYFDFGDAAKQGVRGLLSSLVVQLSAKSDLCYNTLSALYSKHDTGLRLPDNDSLIQCLQEMLGLPSQPSIYIIIDALDECPDTSGVPSPRELVLNLIEDLVGLHLPNLRVCVTSRPEADIREVFGSLVSFSVSLHDEAGQKQDIIDYISSAVQSDRRMRKWRAEDRQLVINALTERVDGMFRWVFCQLEALRSCFPPALRRVLEELPKTLDTTYERILLGIENARREYAFRLLQCLAVSIRPLRVEELAEVLAVPLDGENSRYHSDWHPEDARQAVLSACSSLIAIVNVNGSPVVQFSHFSVKEFLMSSRLANAGEHLSLYHILPNSSHTFLSRSCLSILLGLDDKVEKSAVEKRPFAIYAAQYWVDHAKFEGVSLSVQDLMERLFDPDGPYFAKWIWLYDVDRPWKWPMPTMRPMQPEAGPLYYAALCGFYDLTKHLIITHQTDIDAEGGDHGTALNAALAKGELEIARTLLQNGANVNAVDRGGGSSLHRAADIGHVAVVELLLDHQADVNLQSDKKCETPLHLAAQAGELDICRLLLKQGASTISKDKHNDIPLHNASRNGHLDLVEIFLEVGVDIDIRNARERTPIHLASGGGHLKVVSFLLKHGANVNLCDVRGWTPLHTAAGNGHLNVVQSLLDHDIGVQDQNEKNETPLMLASSRGHVEVSRVLIEHQADVNSISDGGWTSLHIASRRGHTGVVQLLLDQGVDVNVQKSDLWAPLHLASSDGHLKIAELLIKRGAVVDVRNEDQETPLDLASGNGELDVARLLIKCGSNVNSQDKQGWTPSHTAARDGHLSLVELLLDSGANVDIRNSRDETPFDLAWKNKKHDVASFLARRSGNARALDIISSTASKAGPGLQDSLPDEIMEQDLDGGDSSPSSDEDSNSLHGALVRGRIGAIQRLLAQGADVDERDERLKTPLYVASKKGKLEIARTLIEYGADVNTQDGRGWTPLHSAAGAGHIDIVRLLLDNRADIHATERKGCAALHIASGNNRLETVRFLLERGANAQMRNVYGRTPSQHAQLYGHRRIALFVSEYDAGGV